MVPRQRHGRPLIKYGAHVRFLILAAHDQQFSRLMLPPHELLERQPRRIEPDAAGSVLAANTRPERLVAVQHDDFGGGTPHSVKLPRDHRRQRGEEHRSIRNMSEFVARRIVIIRHGIPRGKFGRGGHIDAVDLLQNSGQG